MADEYIKQLAETMARQTQLMEVLAAKNGKGRLHTKTPADTWTATGTFQPGGIFSTPGTDRDVFTAMITSQGLGAVLPVRPSLDTNPRFATLTGFTATTGDRPDYPCDDSPAGFMKGCYLTARFGRTSFDTQTIEVDRMNLRANRGVFNDLVLHGSVFGNTGFVPGNLSDADILSLVVKSEMVGAGVQMERDLERQLWQGVVTQFSAHGGFQEFPGLDVQIATGQVDADTNTACPSLDSDVKDFAYDLIGGSGRDIVLYLAQLEAYLVHNAQRMRLWPADWWVCMTPDLWQELSAIYPCAYNTNRCSNAMVGTQSQLIISGDDMVAQRDQMRSGMYIDINGRRYDVIVDDGIHEQDAGDTAQLNPAEYASSIYMVPKTVVNGFPVTYLEHVDYRAGAANIALLRGLPAFWSDDGRYYWAMEQIKYCLKLTVKTEQRVVLRTPQLAGRIDNVKYSPLQHLRSEFPSSPYHYDGGVSLRGTYGNTYSVWLDNEVRQ